MILTCLKDRFPKHENLKLFALNLDNKDNSSILKSSKKNIPHNKNLNLKIFQSIITFKEKDEMESIHSSSIRHFSSRMSSIKTIRTLKSYNTNLRLSEKEKIKSKWRGCCCKKDNISKGNYSLIINDSESNLNAKSNKLSRYDMSLMEIFDNYNNYFNECFMFYSENISNVEINFKGKITKIYFKIPFFFKFQNVYEKKKILLETSSFNQNQRLNYFLKKINLIKFELIHKQSVSKYKFLSKIILNWKFFSNVLFYTALILNFLLISFVKYNDNLVCLDSQCSINTVVFSDKFITGDNNIISLLISVFLKLIIVIGNFLYFILISHFNYLHYRSISFNKIEL